MSEGILSFENVRLSYGRTCILKNVTWSFARGRSYALMGANGAGKSTLLKTAVGLVAPCQGTCLLLGRTPTHRHAREGACYVPEKLSFPPRLRGSDLMKVLTSNQEERMCAGTLLEKLGFPRAHLKTPIGALSKGTLQKLLLGLMLSQDKTLFLLDEMTSGLDSPTTLALQAYLDGLKSQGKTLIFTTHSWEEARRLGDETLLLKEGTLEKCHQIG